MPNALILAVGCRPALSARERDCARLGAFISLFFGEADRSSGYEVIKVPIEHAMAMEIDLAVVRRLDEAVALFRENAGNAGNRRQFVYLDVAPELAKMILEAAPGRIECISDRDRQIIGRLPVDGNLRTGRAEIDPNAERASFAVVMNGSLDHDVASGEPREVELKVVGAFADLLLHGRGQLKIT